MREGCVLIKINGVFSAVVLLHTLALNMQSVSFQLSLSTIAIPARVQVRHTSAVSLQLREARIKNNIHFKSYIEK